MIERLSELSAPIERKQQEESIQLIPLFVFLEGDELMTIIG